MAEGGERAPEVLTPELFEREYKLLWSAWRTHRPVDLLGHIFVQHMDLFEDENGQECHARLTDGTTLVLKEQKVEE
jgi:hypothetical protein